jgi:hypothetical protein
MTEAAPPAWWKNWKYMVPLWAVMACLVWWAIESSVEPTVIAGGVVVVGLVTNAFIWLLGLVGLVPVVGPIVVGLVTTGFLLLINAVSSIVSYIAIKRGYTRDMLTFKGVTIALIIGVAIGFIIGRLIP